MAVSPLSLLIDEGGLIDSEAAWPGKTAEDVRARLILFLQQGRLRALAGATEPEKDEVARAYTYASVFRAIQIRLAMEPASADAPGQGSRSYTSAQITAIGELADQWDTRLLELTTEPAAVEEMSIAGGWSVIGSLRHG